MENTIKRLQQRLMNATDEDKEDLIFALDVKYEITDVLPPPNHEDPYVLLMAVTYMFLFLLGTCGNVAVLSTICQMIRSGRATMDNTLIYVVVLSCVDFCVCLSLPLTVMDQILGFWPGGSFVCKVHAVLENFGKVLSALILAAMSFDRFAGVCHPHKKWLRSNRFAICVLLGLVAYAFITLCPLLWSFTTNEVILFERETSPFRITRMKIEKCGMTDVSSPIFTTFTLFLFVLCYLVPLFLVTFFYSSLLIRLRKHARQFTASHIPLMRISLYTLAVVCFYFVCWTPFWISTAVAVYLEHTQKKTDNAAPSVFVYLMYFIHALPFTNSAINWILYGALNSQLQNRYRGGRRAETGTFIPNGNSNCLTLKAVSSVNSLNTPQRFMQNSSSQPGSPGTCLRPELLDADTQTDTTRRSLKRTKANGRRLSTNGDDSNCLSLLIDSNEEELTFL